MTDEEREALIAALKAALEAAASALRYAPHYPLPIVDAEPVPPYGGIVANRLMEIYRAARERQGEE